MALDPTGRFAATAGWDSESWVWDLERREVVHRFSFPALNGGMLNVQWFDEETLVLGSEDWAVCGRRFPTLRMGKELQSS